jgi:ribosome-associated protein
MIPEGEYTLSYVRSPGPGGQNVNKVSSACELRFYVAATSLLDAGGKQRLRHLAGRRLTQNDEIVIEAHRHRGQEANRRDAIERLEELITRARHVPKPRNENAAEPRSQSAPARWQAPGQDQEAAARPAGTRLAARLRLRQQPGAERRQQEHRAQHVHQEHEREH